MRLPYDPDMEGIWKYYKVIKITPIVIDKLLVILLTIPIIDSTLELNIYRVRNLPAITPWHKIATKYLLEGDEQTHPLGADTPPWEQTPWEQTHPLWSINPTGADTPLGADTPQSRHPPEQTPPLLRNRETGSICSIA